MEETAPFSPELVTLLSSLATATCAWAILRNCRLKSVNVFVCGDQKLQFCTAITIM